MSRWIPVTVADLNDAKVGELVDALRTAALADGQDDPSPRAIQSVVTEVRRKIASCRTNRVDADETTIPASLLPLVTDLVIFRLKTRLEIPLTTDESKNQDRYDVTLNRIASCADVVDSPDDAIVAPVEATSGTPSISNHRPSRRRFWGGGL